MRRIFSGLLSAVLVTGCFSVGTRFATHEVGRIKVGATTRGQVEQQFGQPWRTGFEDGDETWTYGRYVYSLLAPARTADLTIRFDRNGVVRSYTFSSTDPGP
jgi:hypothetical protein